MVDSPLTSDEVEGFRPIRIRSRRSVPLKRSPDANKALVVGGHPTDGEGAYFAIGHRLLKKPSKRGTRGTTLMPATPHASAPSTPRYSDLAALGGTAAATPARPSGSGHTARIGETSASAQPQSSPPSPPPSPPEPPPDGARAVSPDQLSLSTVPVADVPYLEGRLPSLPSK